MSESKVTAEDLQKMDPAKLLRMVEEVCGMNGRKALSTMMDTLTANTELPLEGNSTVTASAPVPVPFGVLKGREDLGDLGISVSITYSLESLEAVEKKLLEAKSAG